MRVLRNIDWRGFGALGVSRVIELLWALLSRLLSDNNYPFPPLDVRMFGRARGWRCHFSKHGYSPRLSAEDLSLSSVAFSRTRFSATQLRDAYRRWTVLHL